MAIMAPTGSSMASSSASALGTAGAGDGDTAGVAGVEDGVVADGVAPDSAADRASTAALPDVRASVDVQASVVDSTVAYPEEHAASPAVADTPLHREAAVDSTVVADLVVASTAAVEAASTVVVVADSTAVAVATVVAADTGKFF